MAESILPIKTPPLPINTGNISGLIPNKDALNTLSSIQRPQTFGDQIKDPNNQQLTPSNNRPRLSKLLKDKVALIKEGIQLEINHITYVNITLFNKKTPKKQLVNGVVKEIDAEITEEEYQTALIIENGGTLPNGQIVKGNYPEAKENLRKRKEENQKAIDDFFKDPFQKQKKEKKERKKKRKEKVKKSKEDKRKARRERTKTLLKSAKAAKALAPVAMVMISNKIAEIIAQSDKIGKLVNDTNAIIEDANLSNNPEKLQSAKLSRDNAIRIIDDNIKKLQAINNDIQRISSYIGIFSTIVNTITAIPIPTAVPPGIGIPVNLIMRFFKILDKANRIVLLLSAYIPSILSTLQKAIQILNDYKSQLLNINGEIDNASTSTETPEDFLTPPSGTDFPEYKGFKFALREEDNPEFVVRGYKRRYAVAINKAGVEVLKSEFSFTLDPNDLIEQLKLLIDQRNLSASSSNSFGSTGTGNTGRVAGNTSQFQISTPSSSNINAAKKAALTQPPQPVTIQGPTKTLTEKIPLSTQKKTYLRGLSLSPLPNIVKDANFILREDKKWQAKFKIYRESVSRDILRLEP